MKNYIGTKELKATPMTRAEYNTYRGWELPANEKREDEGYLVEYAKGSGTNHEKHEGYISWSPKDVFEEAYRENGNFNFGDVLLLLKKGKKVARKGWNGKDMFLYYVKANSYPVSGNPGSAVKGYFEGDLVPYGAYIALKTAQGNVCPWGGIGTDVLAEDWVVLD